LNLYCLFNLGFNEIWLGSQFHSKLQLDSSTYLIPSLTCFYQVISLFVIINFIFYFYFFKRKGVILVGGRTQKQFMIMAWVCRWKGGWTCWRKVKDGLLFSILFLKEQWRKRQMKTRGFIAIDGWKYWLIVVWCKLDREMEVCTMKGFFCFFCFVVASCCKDRG
jgi:hypothetical protein